MTMPSTGGGSAGDPNAGGGSAGDPKSGGGSGGGGSAGSGNAGGEGAGSSSEKLQTLEAELATLRESNERLAGENARRRKDAERVAGIDPERYRKLEGAEKEREQKRLEEEGKFQEIIATKAKEIETEREAHAQTRRQWERQEIANELLSAASALDPMEQAVARGNNGEPSQIERLFGTDFEKRDGKILHKTAKDDKGNALDAKGFLKAARDGVAANLFKSSLKPGAGSESGGGSPQGDSVTISRSDTANKVRLVEEADKKRQRIVWTD